MAEHYPPKTELRDGMRIDWDVWIAMDDGISLAADIFRPNDEQPHPVLLAAGTYGKGVPFAEVYAQAVPRPDARPPRAGGTILERLPGLGASQT